MAANRRYLDFLSGLDDPTIAIETIARLSAKVEDGGRAYRGFNFFAEPDLHLFEIVVRGEYTLRGFRNTDLRKHLPDQSSGQVSRMLKRLWMHDLIKKVGGTYKYYLTELGRTVIPMGLKLKQLVLIALYIGLIDANNSLVLVYYDRLLIVLEFLLYKYYFLRRKNSFR